MSSEMLGELALAVDHCEAAVRKLEGKRGTTDLKRLAHRNVIVKSNVIVSVLFVLSVDDLHVQLLPWAKGRAPHNHP
jgi:hypothetical protein